MRLLLLTPYTQYQGIPRSTVQIAKGSFASVKKVPIFRIFSKKYILTELAVFSKKGHDIQYSILGSLLKILLVGLKAFDQKKLFEDLK
jgi:hypothetical protein